MNNIRNSKLFFFLGNAAQTLSHMLSRELNKNTQTKKKKKKHKNI